MQNKTRVVKNTPEQWCSLLATFLLLAGLLFGCDAPPRSAETFVSGPGGAGNQVVVPGFMLGDSVIGTATRPAPALLPASAYSAPVTPFMANENTHFISYGVEDGLAHNSIWCSYYDHLGNLWIGTNGGGVSKFDGGKFTSYSVAHGLNSNTVRCVTEDWEGNIWVGTYGGLNRIDGRQIASYPFDGKGSGFRVNALAVDGSGRLWVGTDSGLYVYKKEVGLRLFPLTADGRKPAVRTLHVTRRGTLWVGANKWGAVELDGNDHPKTRLDSFDARFFTGQIYGIMEDHDGNIWFGSDVQGIAVYHPATGQLKGYTRKDGLADDVIHAVYQDAQHRIWIGSWGKGVSMYDPREAHPTFTNYTVQNGLSDDWISTIIEDHNGNIWFGTFNKGLCQFRGNALKSYGKEQGIAGDVICSIAESGQGDICLGTDGAGIASFSRGSFRNSSPRFKHMMQPETYWSTVSDHRGVMWYGTRYNGACAYQDGAFRQFTNEQGLPNSTVWSMLEDRDKKLWFGTGRGISCYDGKSFRNYFPAADDPKLTAGGLTQFTNVICIYQDRAGEMWFGTMGSGLIHFSGNAFFRYTKATGLLSDMVYDVTEDRQGNLLIGTEAGINILQLHNGDCSRPVFRKITAENGLPDNCVRHVIPLDDGRMAVSTNNGLAFFALIADSSSSQLLSRLECFNTSTGYAINSINPGQSSVFKDRNGILWFGDRSMGLSRFDYREVGHDSAPPLAVIETIRLDQNNVSWDLIRHLNDQDTALRQQRETFYYGRKLSDSEHAVLVRQYADVRAGEVSAFGNLPAAIILPYAYNSVTFAFNCTEVDRHDVIQYQYMLEGYDKDWNIPTKNSTATFGHISEGQYRFKVRACNPSGVWGPIVSYGFEVRPPWYRSWWAYLLYIGAGIGIIVMIFRARTATLRRRQKVLRQTVAEKTAELTTKNEAIESLLLNILPQEVVEELQVTERPKAKNFDNVTVLFTDFKDFTKIAEKLEASELVEDLNLFFRQFDDITEKYGVEKIKTIGDSYMAVGGLPTPSASHATDVVNAALEMRDFMLRANAQRAQEGKEIYEIRIGVHSGSVVAGIVGKRKYAYDIWGDCVNVASRMESSGEPMKVNISERTHQLVKNHFHCTSRGAITAKHGLVFEMYFVEHF